MKGIDFIFDYIDKIYYSCYKITLTANRSNRESPKWLKIKRQLLVCSKNEDAKCFKYVVDCLIASFSYVEIGNHSQKISYLTPFSNQYN